MLTVLVAQNIMLRAGVPCVPGYHGPNQDPDFLKQVPFASVFVRVCLL